MAAVDESIAMFRPPVNRAMKVLDRSFFQKTIPTSIAKVLDKKQITKLRTALSNDVLKIDRMQCMRSVRDNQGQETKAFLLQPLIKPNGEAYHHPPCLMGEKCRKLMILVDASTWSPSLADLVRSSQIAVIPYDLTINYDYWTYCKPVYDEGVQCPDIF